MEDRCICCGKVIPEGWMVCYSCENGYSCRENTNKESLEEFIMKIDKAIKRLEHLQKAFRVIESEHREAMKHEDYKANRCAAEDCVVTISALEEGIKAMKILKAERSNT